MAELQHIWGETEEGYAARVKAHVESLRKCEKAIRERRAKVAETVWPTGGRPRLGIPDFDSPKWADVDHLLEIIDRHRSARRLKTRSAEFYCEHCERDFEGKPHATEDGYWLCDPCWRGLKAESRSPRK